MGLHLDPFEQRPIQGDRYTRVGDIDGEARLGTHGIEVIAHGAMVCPDCRAPVVIPDATPVGTALECGYCGHADRARGFLVRDVYDTVANEAYLVARLRV